MYDPIRVTACFITPSKTVISLLPLAKWMGYYAKKTDGYYTVIIDGSATPLKNQIMVFHYGDEIFKINVDHTIVSNEIRSFSFTATDLKGSVVYRSPAYEVQSEKEKLVTLVNNPKIKMLLSFGIL